MDDPRVPDPPPTQIRPELSIVISVMDEEATITPVLEEIAENLGGELDFEVVMVDDGSRDRTRELIAETRERFEWLRLVCHRQNYGKSAGLLTGIRAARAEWIATMDGDGQNHPKDVLRMYREARRLAAEGSVIVAGRRRRRRDTWVKRLSSRVANRVRRALLDDDTPDTGCGLKVFERRVFLELPHFKNMHRFLPALFIRQGARVASLDVEDRPRAGGISKYGFHNRLWVGISDLRGVMWLKRRPCRPILAEEER